ncbi:MAG: TonB-dependent receptor, partial [Lentisphaerae bacterium]|nr:TonB-dependent receptor [Lentisphaerota bacterium]
AMQRWEEQYSPYNSYGGVMRALLKHNSDASTAFDAGYVLRSGDYERKVDGLVNLESRERDWEYNAGVIHAHSFIEDNVLRLGLQYNRWTCPDGKRFFVGKRMDVDTVSAVIMDEHTWDRLTLDGGVRATRKYYRDYTDATFNLVGDNLNSQPINDEWGDTDFTGTLGAKYGVAPWTALYSHLAAGAIDAPPGAVSESNSNLKRETRLILDGGISFEEPDLGNIKFGLFATLRQDAVVMTDTKIGEDGDLFNTYANRDVRQYGVELECQSARFAHFFNLFGNATLMNSRSYDTGWNSYREIPEVIASAGINAVVGRFDASLFGKYVGSFENKRFADDGQYHDLGDFVDLNLTVGAALGQERATRVYASLKNMLDDKYSTVIGYPNYGFQAFVGLEHKM